MSMKPDAILDHIKETLDRLTREHLVPEDALRTILIEVSEERDRQDAKWGGAAHDDNHTMAEWIKLIKAYADWAEAMHGMNSLDKARKRLIQVAAMAVAVVEFERLATT